MRWLRPWMVSALSVLSLLTTMSFFAGVGLSFHQDFVPWGEFFRPRAILFVWLPFASWAVYMYARVVLGESLNERGDFDAALKYARARTGANFWLRSRREALIHRLAMGRAALALNDYILVDEALVFDPELTPPTFREQLRLSWLRMEYHLRMDNLVAAREAYETYQKYKTPPVERARQMACCVELACRTGNEEEATRWLEQAAWSEGDHPRVQLARAHWLARFGHRVTDTDEALSLLDAAAPHANVEIPGRAPELCLMRARLHEQTGDADAARAAADEARALVEAGTTDQRAERLLRDWDRAHGVSDRKTYVDEDRIEEEE